MSRIGYRGMGEVGMDGKIEVSESRQQRYRACQTLAGWVTAGWITVRRMEKWVSRDGRNEV